MKVVLACLWICLGFDEHAHHSSGYFLKREAHGYKFDRSFALALGDFLVHEPHAESVLDLGSGPGHYIGILAMLGIEVQGIDANPRLFSQHGRQEGDVYRGHPDSRSWHAGDIDVCGAAEACGVTDARAAQATPQEVSPLSPSARAALDFSLSLVRHHDLSAPLPRFWRFGWVLALEIAEHVPLHLEPDFLLNVHRHNSQGVVISWAPRRMSGIGHVNCRDHKEVTALFWALGYDRDVDAEETLRSRGSFSWFAENTFIFRRRLPLVDVARDSVESRTAAKDRLSVALSNLARAFLPAATPFEDTETVPCCNERDTMQRLLQVSHFLACFTATRDPDGGGACAAHDSCCGPEGRAQFFGDDAVFLQEECCGPGTKSMWTLYDIWESGSA